jgi:hypothetical protein
VSFDQAAASPGPGKQVTVDKPVTVKGHPAGKGYDLVTGVGTVNADRLVYELAGR